MILVWYCRKCRQVIRAEPRGAVKKGCKCTVPSIGGATKVWT